MSGENPKLNRSLNQAVRMAERRMQNDTLKDRAGVAGFAALTVTTFLGALYLLANNELAYGGTVLLFSGILAKLLFEEAKNNHSRR